MVTKLKQYLYRGFKTKLAHKLPLFCYFSVRRPFSQQYHHPPRAQSAECNFRRGSVLKPLPSTQLLITHRRVCNRVFFKHIMPITLIPTTPAFTRQRHGQAIRQATQDDTAEQDTVLIEQQRSRKSSKSHTTRVLPVDDALAGDEFRKGKTQYQHLKTITPVFTGALKRQIQAELLRYTHTTGRSIPPAIRWLVHPTQTCLTPITLTTSNTLSHWKTNKPARLEVALWIMAHLPPATSGTEAMNQLACVLQCVESVALDNAQARIHSGNPNPIHIDPKPLKLTETVAETIQGQPLQVSYGIQHVTLFSQNGAVQVQCLPEHLRGVDYQKRATTSPHIVLLNKPGARGLTLWP